jgi:hypothetical protein
MADEPATREEARRWAAAARDAYAEAKPAQSDRLAEIDAFLKDMR